MILAIHHTSFIISNLEAARYFYSDVLGLAVDNNRPALSFDGLWLNINETQQIHLLCVENPDPAIRPQLGGRDRHTAFITSNLTALQLRLDEEGIAYTPSQSGRTALFVRDPDGNTLEIIQKD